MSFQLRSATSGDLDLLTGMNHRLIQDEKSANRMDLSQLRERMKSWLAADYHAVIFEQSEVIGYALYRFQGETFEARQVVYVRQFFIEQPYRRQGLGREAFAQLRQTYFENARITLEALTTNPSGLAFWQSLGFEPYAVTLQLD